MTLPLPESAPSFGGPISRFFGRVMLRMVGMKLGGTIPDVPKAILLGAPHTSNWDLILALGMRYAVGLKYSWMMKAEAFFFPFGGMFKAMGGIPIDRKSAQDLPAQMADWFASQDKAYLGITPEGTRSKVPALKKGYWRIAKAANVPVFLVAIDAENKEVVLDKIWNLTDDLDADNTAIKAYYDANYKGIRPELG